MKLTRFILISLFVSMGVYFAVTWPLGAEFHAGIPSSNRPELGGARYMIPGDHLQFLYQLWMLADSFTGGTPLFYHVYEFNQGNDQALYNPGSYYFPFGLVYSLGYALGGRVVGWNLMLCATVWLIYLSTWLLLMRFSRSVMTAAVAALPSILLPYFYVSLLGGSPTGMGMLWVPLIFLGVDVAIRDRWLGGGILAGILLFICSWVDLHVFFFVFLATPVWALLCLAFNEGSCLDHLRASRSFVQNPSLLVDEKSLNRSTQRTRRGLALLPILIGMIGAYLQTSLIKASLADTLQSKGRTISESLGYALRPHGWFDVTLDNRDNIIYLGVFAGVILLLGLVLLGYDVWRAKEKNPPLTPPGRGSDLPVPSRSGSDLPVPSRSGSGFRSPPWRGKGWVSCVPCQDARVRRLWLYGMVLAAIAGIAILALGPNTPFDPHHRLWQGLRTLIPPYKMIRQPAKIYCLLAPFLGIALAMAIDRLTGGDKRRTWGLFLTGIIAVGLLVDYGRRVDPTICLLDYEQGGYRAVAEDAAKCGRENRAMAIPLWPGDSHWNSITEYYSTLYRTKMLNGYSPSVSRQYFTNVFLRFEAVNMGVVTDDILDGLLAMKVGYLLLHEDAFPQKVSPFSVEQTLRELRHHPRLQFLAQDKAVWAFKILVQGETAIPPATLPDVPLLAGWQWDACDVAGGAAAVVNDGSNVCMRLAVPDGWIQLDPRTLYPLQGLRYVVSVRGEGVLAGSCGSGVTGDAFAMKIAAPGEWTWMEILAPVLPAGRQTFLAPVFTNVAGSVDVSMLTLVGGGWKWLKPGERLVIPAAACFHSAFSGPDRDGVQLEKDRVQAGVAFYAPVVPVLPGRYRITLECQVAAGTGTVVGTWSVMRTDGQGQVSIPVVAGSVTTLEYALTSPRPLRLEFDYNRKAGMRIQGVTLTRIQDSGFRNQGN